MIYTLNLLTVSNIFYHLPAILFIAKTVCHNEFFDKRCNDIEKYLLEKSYSEKMVRKEILRARAIPWEALLEKVNNQEKQNITSYVLT